jgi:hypothetical protein
MIGLMLSLLATTAQAQQPGGGFGGFGGFGGGLTTQLHTNKDLQEELKLSTDQIDKFKEFSEKNTPRVAGGGGGGLGGIFGGGGGLGGIIGGGSDLDTITSLEKQIKTVKDRIEFVKTTLDKTQYERLTQLENQRLGLRAFTNERIATELKVTDEQKKRFAEINTDLGKETAGLFTRRGGFDREKIAEATNKMNELNGFALEAMEKELTDDQKSAWSKMTGKKFDVSKLQPQFRPMGKN